MKRGVVSTPVTRVKRAVSILVTAVFAAAVLALVGCSNTPPAEKPQLPTSRPPMNRTTPENAVKSYLDWTTFAYRMINSELASQAESPDEGVRVDSYIELLKQKGRGIDQHLTAFSVVRSSVEGTRTLIATKETWSYRYFSSDGKSYLTPAYSTSYDSTYTVIKQSDGSWVVDRVQATPLDEVH